MGLVVELNEGQVRSEGSMIIDFFPPLFFLGGRGVDACRSRDSLMMSDS